jgi:hypothetical protein
VYPLAIRRAARVKEARRLQAAEDGATDAGDEGGAGSGVESEPEPEPVA